MQTQRLQVNNMVCTKTVFIVVIEIVILVKQHDAFQITNSSISPKGPVKVGGTVELMCQTDDDYEYCDWWVGNFTLEKECKFEWKRKHGGVRRQKCDNLRDRMEFDGNYDAHECKVVLSNVGLKDAGIWTCKIEEYAGLGRAPVRRKQLELVVLERKQTLKY